MSIQNRIFKKFEDFTFFQIYIETKTGNILEDFKDILTADEIKKLDKNKIIRIRNNDSFLTIDNWNKLKDIFFFQRMETYNSSYTDVEKINLELEDLDKIPINKPEYKTLKKRYKKYLLSKLKQPQLTEIKKTKNLEQFITNIESKQNFLKDLKETFPTEKGKSIKAIIDLLVSDNIIIYGTKEFTQLYNELKLFFDRNIGTYNSIQNVKEVDNIIIDVIQKKLNPLIIKYKSN